MYHLRRVIIISVFTWKADFLAFDGHLVYDASPFL